MATRIREPAHLPRDATRHSLWWIIGVSLLVVVVVAALVLRSKPPRVAVIGDSITVFATPAVGQELHGSARLDVRAEMGRRIDEMLPALTQAIAAHPHAVVVDLGTNDVLQAQTHPAWQPGFVRMVALLSSVPCVGITTINTGVEGPIAVPSVAEDINAAISAAVRRHANFHVIDWNAAVHAPGGAALLIPDHVHPTSAGSMRLASLIRAVVTREC